MKVEIIAIGSEMLTAERMDTNSLYLTERLNELGIDVHLKSIVGDDANMLQSIIRAALSRSDLIISTGGLGPTEDDITRQVFAQILQRELSLDASILETLQKRFRKYGIPMPEINARQAMVPTGAQVLKNSVGTAPGLWMEWEGRRLVLLPGPPREMNPMYESEVRPRLEAVAGSRRMVRHVFKIAGLTESMADSMVSPVYSRHKNVTTTILASPGSIELHLTASGTGVQDAERQLAPLEEQIAAVLGDHLYSRRGENLEAVLARVLMEKQVTVAVAESCTGGFVCERLTQTAGSSKFFRGGVVCYTRESKVDLCRVPESLLREKDPVSGEVAEQMAAGVRELYHADFGVGITGVAGPSGGTPETPVGLVYIGFAYGAKVWHKHYQFPGDREVVRFLASQYALDLMRREFIH